MEKITESELVRFNSKWRQVGDCKIWQGYLDKDGYGFFYFRQKLRKAHRVSYYITNGAIKDNLVVDHKCKKRNCVEINHLRLVTKSQNTLENSRSIGAINKAKIFCKNGHKFDKIYGTAKKQRYCSKCENEKSKRLQRKWLKQANKIKC